MFVLLIRICSIDSAVLIPDHSVCIDHNDHAHATQSNKLADIRLKNVIYRDVNKHGDVI